MPEILATTATNFDKSLTDLVIRTLEQEVRPTLPWVRECIPARFVPGTNNTMRFLRVEDMSVVTGTPTPGVKPWLTEGVTPAAEDLDFGYEEFSANQAGRILKLTDLAIQRWSGELMAIATEKITRNAAATADKRVADVVLAGTNVIYAGTSNVNTDEVAAGDVVTSYVIRKAVASLKADGVATFGDGSYHAIINPNVVFDIQGDEAVGGWLDAQKYGGTQALFTGEIGKYAGVRFIESANAPVKAGSGTTSIDVYSTTVFGPGAFVFGDWNTIQSFYTPPGGPGDELHQRSSVGWKGNYGALLLEEVVPRYIRIESASGL